MSGLKFEYTPFGELTGDPGLRALSPVGSASAGRAIQKLVNELQYNGSISNALAKAVSDYSTVHGVGLFSRSNVLHDLFERGSQAVASNGVQNTSSNPLAGVQEVRSAFANAVLKALTGKSFLPKTGDINSSDDVSFADGSSNFSDLLDKFNTNQKALAEWNNEQSLALWQKQADFNAAQADLAWERQKEYAQNAHRWEMADLRAAGLNPVLTATGGSGANLGSVSAASVSSPESYGASSNQTVDMIVGVGSLILSLLNSAKKLFK